jgi:UDP-N-acetylglucosamine 1-carboxyvinyltransferase
MDKIVIKGGNVLRGNIAVHGSKNAALPIIASTILNDDSVAISNVPDLVDVITMKSILEYLGARVASSQDSLHINCNSINKHIVPYGLVREMRASILFLAPLLVRFKKVEISLPGGCVIGPRPINLHLKALQDLGASISLENGNIIAEANELRGTNIYFDISTVSGTENVMMAACFAKGRTVLKNCSREPEVVALADALIRMGANIKGAGTSQIELEGVSQLKHASIELPPDRIVAGTYMIAAALTGGDITVHNCEPEHLQAVIKTLGETGAFIETKDKSIRVQGKSCAGVDVTTLPYPGFPTDLQAQFMVLTCLSKGVSVITETIFENRFMHVSELLRMGADILIHGNSAIVLGVKKLRGAPVTAMDLRASASLILAGLVAEGVTEISRTYHLDRGYCKIESAFSQLGAEIYRQPTEEVEEYRKNTLVTAMPIQKRVYMPWVSDDLPVPRNIRTPIRQFLLFFEDYLQICKGINVNLNVKSVDEGIRVEVMIENEEMLREISKHFQEYLQVTKSATDKIDIVFTCEQPVIKKDLFILELKNEVKQLEVKLEMRELEKRYQDKLINKMDKLMDKLYMNAPHVHLEINQSVTQTVDVDARSLQLYKQTVRPLCDDLIELKSKLLIDNSAQNEEVIILSDLLHDLNIPVKNVREIPKSVFGKLQEFILEAKDKNSNLGRTLISMKDGLILLQKIAKRYNKIAQWFGMPQVPDAFL